MPLLAEPSNFSRHTSALPSVSPQFSEIEGVEKTVRVDDDDEEEEPIVESVQSLPSRIPGTQESIEEFGEFGEGVDLDMDVDAEEEGETGEEAGGDASFARDHSVRSHHFSTGINLKPAPAPASAPAPTYTHPARRLEPAPPIIEPAYVLPADQRVDPRSQQHQQQHLRPPPSAGPSKRQPRPPPSPIAQAVLHPFLEGESPPNDTSTPARRVQVLSQPQRIYSAPVFTSSAEPARPQPDPQQRPIALPSTSRKQPGPPSSQAQPPQPVVTNDVFDSRVDSVPSVAPGTSRPARPSTRTTPAGSTKLEAVHAPQQQQQQQQPVAGTSSSRRRNEKEKKDQTIKQQGRGVESGQGQKSKKDKKRNAEEAGWATDNVEEFQRETGRGGRSASRSAQGSSGRFATASLLPYSRLYTDSELVFLRLQYYSPPAHPPKPLDDRHLFLLLGPFTLRSSIPTTKNTESTKRSSTSSATCSIPNTSGTSSPAKRSSLPPRILTLLCF
jgi:hypothetical protein